MLSADCLLQRLSSSDEHASTTVLEVSAIRRDQAGLYTCRASNDAGNVTTDVSVVVECKPSTQMIGFCF